MDTIGGTPDVLPEAPAHFDEAAPPEGPFQRAKTLVLRRKSWLLGALVFVVLAPLGYQWLFGKSTVIYATMAVVRGDVESTLVAAGIVQPVKYVDVGAQTSGMLKTLKVIRVDQVTESQMLAEIDPILAHPPGNDLHGKQETI